MGDMQRLSVLEGMLADAPPQASAHSRSWFCSAPQPQIPDSLGSAAPGSHGAAVAQMSRDSFSDLSQFQPTRPPTNTTTDSAAEYSMHATPVATPLHPAGTRPSVGGDHPTDESAPVSRGTANRRSADQDSGLGFNHERVAVTTAETGATHLTEAAASATAQDEALHSMERAPASAPANVRDAPSPSNCSAGTADQRASLTDAVNGNKTPPAPGVRTAPSISTPGDVGVQRGADWREVYSAPVDTLAIASGRAPPAPHRRGSPLVDHLTGEVLLDGSFSRRSSAPQTENLLDPSDSTHQTPGTLLTQSPAERTSRHSAGDRMSGDAEMHVVHAYAPGCMRAQQGGQVPQQGMSGNGRAMHAGSGGESMPLSGSGSHRSVDGTLVHPR